MLSRELVLPWLNILRLLADEVQELLLEEEAVEEEETREDEEPEKPYGYTGWEAPGGEAT